MDMTVCPGCGLKLPHVDALADGRFNASAECWQLYGELSAYTLSLNDISFLHQHVVDAYGAQHAGGSSKAITTIFGLIGLYLALEKGYTGRQVQLAHMELAGKSKQWPKLEPPLHTGSMTVNAVLGTEIGEERNSAIRDWMQSIWDAWHSHQARIRELSSQCLDV